MVGQSQSRAPACKTPTPPRPAPPPRASPDQCPDAGDVRPPSSSPGQPAPVGASASCRSRCHCRRHHCYCQVLRPLPPPCELAVSRPHRAVPRWPPPWERALQCLGPARAPSARGRLAPVTARGWQGTRVLGWPARAMATGGSGSSIRPPRPAPVTAVVSHSRLSPDRVWEVAFI
jgi:hypothetical protein